ncbi:MAG: twin-arginine translocation signal domain-containing protein, partial [Burkholderiales bacterium]
MLQEKISRRDFLKTSGALVVTFSTAHPFAEAAT